MSVQVLIERSAAAFIRQRIDVHVFERPGRGYLTFGPGGEEVWTPLVEGGSREDNGPTFSIPESVATEVAAAILDVAPANREQGQALADARAVRDRLLRLVERVVDADIAREASR
jgi:hypothetical protein